MEENQTLGITFYIYALVEIALSVSGLLLFKRKFLVYGQGNNILIYVLALQLIIHIYMMIQGNRNGKSRIYGNFFPFTVPAIVIIFIAWVNTF